MDIVLYRCGAIGELQYSGGSYQGSFKWMPMNKSSGVYRMEFSTGIIPVMCMRSIIAHKGLKRSEGLESYI